MAHPLKSATIGSRDAKLHKIAKTTRMTAGAETGKGRLQKIALQKRAAKKHFVVEDKPIKIRADKRARGGKVKRADGGLVERNLPEYIQSAADRKYSPEQLQAIGDIARRMASSPRSAEEERVRNLPSYTGTSDDTRQLKD